MEFPKFRSVWKWVRHTILVVIIAGIPSHSIISVGLSQVQLYFEGPFWRYSTGPANLGFSPTLYLPSLLLFAVISLPSYLLLFIRGRISNSKPLFKYSIVLAALTAIAGYSVYLLWQYISSVAPDVLYGIWLDLGWSASLVMIFLILFPSINWELTRCISGVQEPALESSHAVHALDSCDSKRYGRLLFYTSILAPYAYQNMSRNPIIFGSVFYTLDFGSSSYGMYFSFHGYTIPIMILIMATTALRLLFAYEVLMFTLGKAKDRDVVAIGLLSLVSDWYLMPRVFLEVSFIVGPFPLLFVTGLLIMYKCFSERKVPQVNQAR